MDLSKRTIKEIKKSQIKHLRFNKGSFGVFYLLSEDKGVKIIRNKDANFRFHFDLDTFIPLTNVKVHGVSLPEEIGYDEFGNFKGYKLSYYEGQLLPKALRTHKKISWELIDQYFDTLYDKVIELTDKKVLIYDIEPHNIIVGDKELNIIDCDFFKYAPNVNPKGLFIANTFELYLGIERLKDKNLKEHLKVYFKKKRGKK